MPRHKKGNDQSCFRHKRGCERLLVPTGKPAEILSLARKGKLHIFLSQEIIDEIKRTLLSPKLRKIHKDTPEQTSLFIRAFSKVATVVPGTISVDVTKLKTAYKAWFTPCKESP